MGCRLRRSDEAEFVAPVHRCTRTHSPSPRTVIAIRSISEPHSAARSPGRPPSRCMLHKQFGQWLRCAVQKASLGTSSLQWPHRNERSFCRRTPRRCSRDMRDLQEGTVDEAPCLEVLDRGQDELGRTEPRQDAMTTVRTVIGHLPGVRHLRGEAQTVAPRSTCTKGTGRLRLFMANIKSQIKRNRQNDKRHDRNTTVRSVAQDLNEEGPDGGRRRRRGDRDRASARGGSGAGQGGQQGRLAQADRGAEEEPAREGPSTRSAA